VGRGLPFWLHNYTGLKTLFADQFKNISVDAFYKGINRVETSLIRTEADELTYHFHVMIRYEIEKMLIDGSISAKDIPAYWSEHYKQYLGVSVPDDKRGCLQDIHWSHGSFGYFATYSLGSIMAAQLYAAIEKENASVNKEGAEGNTSIILNWLRDHIYQYGRQYTSQELCTKITDEPMNTKYFIDYVTKKYQHIYNF